MISSVGAYVCDHCRMTCESLYEAAMPSTSTYWLCRGYKEAVATKQQQPAQLRAARSGAGSGLVRGIASQYNTSITAPPETIK